VTLPSYTATESCETVTVAVTVPVEAAKLFTPIKRATQSKRVIPKIGNFISVKYKIS
jgi:hypothetical protein